MLPCSDSVVLSPLSPFSSQRRRTMIPAAATTGDQDHSVVRSVVAALFCTVASEQLTVEKAMALLVPVPLLNV